MTFAGKIVTLTDALGNEAVVGARRTSYLPAFRPVVTTAPAGFHVVSEASLYSIDVDVLRSWPSIEISVVAVSPFTLRRESVTAGRVPITIFAVSLAVLYVPALGSATTLIVVPIHESSMAVSAEVASSAVPLIEYVVPTSRPVSFSWR